MSLSDYEIRPADVTDAPSLGRAHVRIWQEAYAGLMDADYLAGLDPRARIEMRELIKELRKMNKTIMVSSHILPELADICNKIGIIERGKLLAAGSIQEIQRKLRTHRVLRVQVLEDAVGRIADFLATRR